MTFPARTSLPDARLDRLVAQILAERADDAIATALPVEVVRDRIATRSLARWSLPVASSSWRSGLVLLAVLTLLAVALAAAWTAGSRGRSMLASQAAIAASVTDAINDRDVIGLRSYLAPDAVLVFPAVDARTTDGRVFQSQTSLDNNQGFLDFWVESLGGWGLQAELRTCRPGPEASLACDAWTRWHTLQLEIGETWTFATAGERVTRLEMVRSDPAAPGGILPMRLGDLDAWADWLRERHPDQALRLLPTGPDLFSHLFFRFGLDAPKAEIHASILEYLESRS